MDAVPDGEWFCPDCEADPGAPVRLDGVKRILTKGKKGKAADFDDEPVAGQKRKASSQAARKLHMFWQYVSCG